MSNVAFADIEAADPLISLSKAGRFLALDEKPRNPVTVWRDCTKGHPHPVTGQRIKLRHIKIGRRIATRKSWCEQFIRDLSEARQSLPATESPSAIKPTAPARSANKREAAAQAAGDELRKLGF